MSPLAAPPDLAPERALLGGLLLDSGRLAAVRATLDAADFYLDAHGAVYRALGRLTDRGAPAGTLALLEELESGGMLGRAGGRDAVLALLGDADTSAGLDYWAGIVHDRAARRRLAAAAADPHADPDELRELAAAVGQTGRSRPVPGVRADTVKPQRVSWLWPGRIPLGRLTVLDGDPGLGKSTVTLDLAARVSTGRAMPDGMPGVRGGVVLLSAEDGVADTIRPRLDAAGADCARVRVVGADDGLLAIPSDLPELERAIEDVGARLVVVDPLSAYLGAAVNAWRDGDVRRALGPLAGLAERSGAAILVVRHLNKSGGASPLYRGGGSIGIIGAARSGLLVASDPDDDSRRVLAASKANLSAKAPSLAFRLAAVVEAGAIRVEWLAGTSPHSAEQLLAVPSDPEARSTLDAAAEALADVLRDGPVASKAARQQVLDAVGCSPRTLDSAKTRLGVVARKHGVGVGSGWAWELPPKDARPDARDRPSEVKGAKDANAQIPCGPAPFGLEPVRLRLPDGREGGQLGAPCDHCRRSAPLWQRGPAALCRRCAAAPSPPETVATVAGDGLDAGPDAAGAAPPLPPSWDWADAAVTS